MCDAAWVLLNEEGAMEKYTRDAWKTSERWFDILNTTLRNKQIKPYRLTCELEEIPGTVRKGWVDYVAVIKRMSRPTLSS